MASIGKYVFRKKRDRPLDSWGRTNPLEWGFINLPVSGFWEEGQKSLTASRECSV